jgi:hypothetical protein
MTVIGHHGSNDVVFQLNRDVTGTAGQSNVDLIALGVNSIQCSNNTMCVSVAPKGTETTYHNTYDELRQAVELVCTIMQCGA